MENCAKMVTKNENLKEFVVGLWINIKTRNGEPTGLQVWHISPGNVTKAKLSWETVILAENEEEAVYLGQKEYSEKLLKKAA